MSEIIILKEKIKQDTLKTLAEKWFEDMIKYVIDIKRKIIAIGGELHSDAKEMLINDGSNQEDLWGANYYLFREPADRIEYTSLINIRPSINNPGMEISDPEIKDKVNKISEKLLLNKDEKIS